MRALAQAAEVMPMVPWLVQSSLDNKWWVSSPHQWDHRVSNLPGETSDCCAEEDEMGSGSVLPSFLGLTLSREELGETCKQKVSCVVPYPVGLSGCCGCGQVNRVQRYTGVALPLVGQELLSHFPREHCIPMVTGSVSRVTTPHLTMSPTRKSPRFSIPTLYFTGRKQRRKEQQHPRCVRGLCLPCAVHRSPGR